MLRKHRDQLMRLKEFQTDGNFDSNELALLGEIRSNLQKMTELEESDKARVKRFIRFLTIAILRKVVLRETEDNEKARLRYGVQVMASTMRSEIPWAADEVLCADKPLESIILTRPKPKLSQTVPVPATQ